MLIGGFIITGTENKPVVIRALGPSLTAQGIAGALADPVLQVFDANGFGIAQNDNWKDTQQTEIEATGIPPPDDLESAVAISLPPSSYTAIVAGKNNGTGIGLVEVYDLDRTVDAQLGNISTRGLVGTDNNVLIAGLIIGNGTGGNVILRGLGPSLSNSGITGALQDPILELRDGNGALVREDDNWRGAQETEIQASGLAPPDNRESAIFAPLMAGNYTAILRGRDETTGVGLVEVYAVP